MAHNPCYKSELVKDNIVLQYFPVHDRELGIWPPPCCETDCACLRKMKEYYGFTYLKIPYSTDDPARYGRALAAAHCAGWQNNEIEVNINWCDADKIKLMLDTAHAMQANGGQDLSNFRAFCLDEPYRPHGENNSCPGLSPMDYGILDVLREEIHRLTHNETKLTAGGERGFQVLSPFSPNLRLDLLAPHVDGLLYTRYNTDPSIESVLHSLFGGSASVFTDDQRSDWTAYRSRYGTQAAQVYMSLTEDEKEFTQLLGHAGNIHINSVMLYALEAKTCAEFIKLLERFVGSAVSAGFLGAVDLPSYRQVMYKCTLPHCECRSDSWVGWVQMGSSRLPESDHSQGEHQGATPSTSWDPFSFSLF